MVNMYALLGPSSPPPSSSSPPKTKPGQCQATRAEGTDKDPSALSPRTASRSGDKLAPVNYITTAASRQRSGIQVAIAFCCSKVELRATRWLSLPPSFSRTSPGWALLLLSVCSLRGMRVVGRDQGAEGKNPSKGDGLRRGFALY